MGITLKTNEMNEVAKGTLLFAEGEPVELICVVLKGRVELYNDSCRIPLTNGAFLGIQDLYMGRWLCSCIAVEDTILYAFPSQGLNTLDNVLSANKDYRGLLSYSVIRYINSLYRSYTGFVEMAEKTCNWIGDAYREYLRMARECGVVSARQDSLEKLVPYKDGLEIDKKKLNFYLEQAAVPLDTMKSFYGAGNTMTQYLAEQSLEICAELMMESSAVTDYLVRLLECLAGANGTGLFAAIVKVVMTVTGGKNGEDISKGLNLLLDGCMDRINELEDVLEKKTGRSGIVDRDRIEKLYIALLTGKIDDTASAGEAMTTEDDQLAELEDSMGQIFRFASFDLARVEQLRALVQEFSDLADKSSTEDDARKIRHGISALFIDLYEQTFFAAHGKRSLPKPVELFLNFGMLSEKLLTREELLFLVSKCGLHFTGRCGNGRVYTMREWLTAVFEGSREPSKSEMDLDYMDNIREMRKSNKITEAQEKTLKTDQHKKVQYEIRNMFTSNERIVSGRVSVFVPVLHHEMFIQNPAESMLDAPKMIDVIRKLKTIDYGVFYREVLISRPDQGIDKFYIMKEYDPDIILMPIVGTRASMWQECAGKRRESAGRFVFPVFFEEDLEVTMIRTFGKYRWELCRFLQGGSWNNIQIHSLTSEYCDYLQFYRKNHDLSEEKREKVKMQLQKARNNSRDVFVQDYEMWIRYESAGAIRLNKPSRDILALYCPLAPKYRAQLVSQPIFTDPLSRWEREKAKTVHDYELRMHQLTKTLKTDMPPEITETMEFYKKS